MRVCEVVLLSGRDFCENGAVECAQPVIDVTHGRCAISLIVAHNSAVFELDVTCIEQTVIAKDRHQTAATTLPERRLHSLIITSEIGITVEDEKLIGQ